MIEQNGDDCAVELESGETVAALAVNTEGPGKPTMLSLRPERVALNPADGECDTKVFGKVEELTYLGDHIRIGFPYADATTLS